VRGEVMANLEQVWTVAEMAKRANLSEARFSALYRKIFGNSPNEELIRARVEHAQFLLAHTSLPIKAVAGKCGFESVPYFSRAFHRRVGCAPRDYLRVPIQATAVLDLRQEATLNIAETGAKSLPVNSTG
jgi:AraC family transcriptional regulator of arabinose operon